MHTHWHVIPWSLPLVTSADDDRYTSADLAWDAALESDDGPEWISVVRCEESTCAPRD